MSDRAVTCAAQNAEVGMPLRPQIPGWPHRLEKIRVSDAGNYVITTNQGAWEFRPTEMLVFPRREDGKTIDWRLEKRHPYLGELHYGDVIDEPLGDAERMVPPWEKDLWETATESQREEGMKMWRDRGQRVMAITPAPKSDGHLFVITTRSGYHSNGRWFVRDDQPIEFPLHGQKYATQVDRKIRSLKGYGPYELADERLAFLVEHPYGAGRWPNWLSYPIKIGSNAVIMRPPGKKDEWPEFLGCEKSGELTQGLKYQRHPHDPKWGLMDADKIAHWRLIDEAKRAYDDYRERYER